MIKSANSSAYSSGIVQPTSVAKIGRVVIAILDLKVDGSINEGPFPKGKGHQRAREDFQPVKGVVCIDGFAVRVLLTPSTGD